MLKSSQAIVSFIVLVSVGSLQAGHVDVRPYVAGGRIVTGTAELIGNVVNPLSDRARVFGAEFGEDDPAQPFFTEDPGFLSEPGAFPGGTGKYVGFDVPTGLQYWTGSAFDAVPASESLQITKGSQTVNVGGPAANGFYFGVVAADDGLHEHFMFELLGSDGNPVPDDGVEPTMGIYLLEMSLRTTMPGAGPSDPFWIVFNNGGEAYEAQHDAAMAWAEAHMAPEPATAILLAFGAGLVVRGKRTSV